MSTAAPGNVVTATITATGVLTVWGLVPSPQVRDEGAPAPARNALVNLLADAARQDGQVVVAAARTPAGPWYFACDHRGVTSPLDSSHFPAHPPALDDAVTLAGAAAVFAAAAGSAPAAMLALASDPDPTIRAEALAELATWPDDPTPVADAELPSDRLERLAGCALAWIRVGVAANPATPPSVLAHLADDDDPQVLLALAARFDLTAELIVQLASVPDPGVRSTLVRNPAASFLPVGPAGHPQDVPPAAAEHPGPATSPASTSAPPSPGAAILAPDSPPPAAHPPVAVTTPPKPRRRIPRVAWAVAVVLLLLVGGYAAAAGRHPAPDPQGAAAMWNGMALPAGPDGPADPTGPVATGFAHTELGAATAAAHLSVRIDPYAGPASFSPTITNQTYGGDPAALLAATQARYTALGGAGGPIPTSTGQITGWALADWTPTAPVTVHLRVLDPAGVATDFGITVVWVDGDYALLDPTRDDTFTTSPATDPYRSF